MYQLFIGCLHSCTGRDGNAACVRDWVDHREPQEIWPPNSHCNQVWLNK